MLLLENLLLHQQVYQDLVLVDANGYEQVHVSRDGSRFGANLEHWREDDAFLYPTSRGEAYFGPVHFDEIIREPLMLLSVPIIDLRSGGG